MSRVTIPTDPVTPPATAYKAPTSAKSTANAAQTAKIDFQAADARLNAIQSSALAFWLYANATRICAQNAALTNTT